MMQRVSSVLKDKKYFIFDLDGTLIKTEENYKQGLWNLVKELKLDVNLYQKLITYLNNSRDSKARKDAYIYFGLIDNCCGTPEEIDQSFKNIDLLYWEGVGQALKWKEGAEDLLLYLTNRNYHMSIVTNGGYIQHKKLQLLNSQLPEGIVKFDMQLVTGDYGKEFYKPHPKCLNKVISFYKKIFNADRTEMIYIGDSIEFDYQMSLNSGIDFVLIDSEDVHYDFEGNRIFELMEIVCD